jgi:ribosome-binding factor A
LSKRLHHLKRIPELTFDYDESVEKSFRIEKLLSEIKSEE